MQSSKIGFTYEMRYADKKDCKIDNDKIYFFEFFELFSTFLNFLNFFELFFDFLLYALNRVSTFPTA